MDHVPYKRDFYDLCYERVGGILTRWIEDEPLVDVSQDQARRLEELNERRHRLNYLSKDLCKVLQRNHALISCITFATHLLHPTAESIVPLETAGRPLAPGRPDTDFEEEVISARLAMARDDRSTRTLIQSLKRINQAILQIHVDSSTTPQKPAVFYRVTRADSHTFYDIDLGFCCAKLLQDHDFNEPSKDEFRSHVNGKHFKSPFISLTDDPGRACKIGQYHSNEHIYFIDATKLQQLNVHIERTTNIAERWKIEYTGGFNRLHYVTSSHWLAHFWIPAECIIRKVSFDDFKEVCKISGVIDSMYIIVRREVTTLMSAGSNDKVTFGKQLPSNAFEKRNRRPASPVQQVIFAEDADNALEGKMQTLSVNKNKLAS